MLSAEQHDVIVIEKDEERRQSIGEYLDIQTVAGNGASPAVLLNAGIRTADMLIAVTEQDEINMVACILAKQFGVQRTVAQCAIQSIRKARRRFLIRNWGLI